MKSGRVGRRMTAPEGIEMEFNKVKENWVGVEMPHPCAEVLHALLPDSVCLWVWAREEVPGCFWRGLASGTNGRGAEFPADATPQLSERCLVSHLCRAVGRACMARL